MKDIPLKNISIFQFLALLVASISLSCGGKAAETPEVADKAENDFKVIAYYTPSTGEIANETASQLDQIIYSFLHLEGNKFDLSKASDNASIAYLTSLKKENPNLKVLVSLGGWGVCETCSEIFSSEEGRREFANSVKNILEDHNSDGIDLDLEYLCLNSFTREVKFSLSSSLKGWPGKPSTTFYARVWEGVDTTSNGLYLPGKFREAILYRHLENFENKHPGFVRYFDSVAQAPYSYNPKMRLFGTYDYSVSIAAKTKYVIDKGLGGIMFWHLSGDLPEKGLLDVIDHIKRNSPE